MSYVNSPGRVERRLLDGRVSSSCLVDGEKFEGEARFLAERTECDRAMAAIRRKYWLYRPFIALGQILTAIGVMRDKTGAFEVALEK
jgi:hypothetical protein